MNLQFSQDELRPLVEAVVSLTIENLQADGSQLGAVGRFAYLESEAANLLGVKASVLRDARLRGEITATKIGGRIGYETAELHQYLATNRQQ